MPKPVWQQSGCWQHLAVSAHAKGHGTHMKCKSLYISSVQQSQHMQVNVFIQKSGAKTSFLTDLTMTFVIQGFAYVYSKLIHGSGGSPLYHKNIFLTENFKTHSSPNESFHGISQPKNRNDTLQLQSLFHIKSWGLSGSWPGIPLPKSNLNTLHLGMSFTALISTKTGWIHYLNCSSAVEAAENTVTVIHQNPQYTHYKLGKVPLVAIHAQCQTDKVLWIKPMCWFHWFL